ncbi:hypothetical protein [Ornithinibacillus halotolerans]|uniref:DUF1404 domain-containing protein n=1 Tax=Ornithinibacillus halotolerans TaxID=1274357 RepID=A0A916RXH3_9BACI|nr:hypothetical protein [Ornithinibacillus halotolerans]GGA74038.1 hypothetical protein GCM10008025_17230 [Ornithinibacillus halotolerans]
MKRSFIIGSLIFLILIIPPIRIYMESMMIIHMLVQLPLLIVVGWCIGEYIENKYPKLFELINGNGVSGIIIFVAITMFWMLPRTLDEALTFPIYEIFKFISLPLAGFLLKDSWRKIKAFGRIFIYLNYLSMFGLMGWLYLDSPIQICNNYLLEQQKTLGWGFIFITALMVLYVLQSVFTDQSEEE